MLQDEFKTSDLELKKSGRNFLGILNDLKRRPEDAAKELGISEDEINSIIKGEKELSSDIVNHATKIWPVNARDFYTFRDDCLIGVKIMKSEESMKSSRIMYRSGKPFYEYRDTAMSTNAPFRPEWIMELCYVNDNDPKNPQVQWNNGHFMHQFTYFIGEVNFYYRLPNGERNVAVMKTGDSMYITPFVPHSFTTRQGAKQNGLILALTYGNKLSGDVQQELSALSTNIGSEFALDFSSKEKASASLLYYHRESASLTLEELSKRTGINIEMLQNFESYKEIPSYSQTYDISKALNVNVRDLLPNDTIEDKVIVKHHDDGKKWNYPQSKRFYEFLELASSTVLPYSKAFEVKIQNNDDTNLDLRAGLHQYVYNIGDTDIKMNWSYNGKQHSNTISHGDSVYVKPFVNHNFRGNGKLLILRVGGKIVGDAQRELSFIGKGNAKRAISESMQSFNPKGKN